MSDDPFDTTRYHDYQRHSESLANQGQERDHAPNGSKLRENDPNHWSWGKRMIGNIIFFLMLMALWFWWTGQFG